MQNIKIMEECLDNPIWNDKSFCKCKKKIIRKPNYFDSMDKVIYCELCDCPILVKDMGKIIDDWRHMQLSEKDLAEVNKILRNKDKTMQILNNILKISEMLKFNLYGIRNRVTDKIIVVGLLDDRVIFADATNWCQAKVWTKREDADEVYRIMCNLDNGFQINYFVDKLSDLELKEYCKVNNIYL
jgi:hypothetical protein